MRTSQVPLWMHIDATSHTLVKIEPVDQSWILTRTELLSDYIARKVYERISLYQAIKGSESISALLLDPDARGYSGKLFEQAVHHKFRRGRVFDPEGITANSAPFRVMISNIDEEADGYFYTLSVLAGKGSQKVADKYLGQYMIPVLKTQESIDSVWLSEEVTVLFQITVSGNHPLKFRGIIKLLDPLPAKAKKDVRIVFVVPAGDKSTANFKQQNITCPIGTPDAEVEVLRRYPQYVHYVDLEPWVF